MSADGAAAGADAGWIGLRLHHTVAHAVRAVADAAATGGRWADPDRRVALSGGVFADPLLVELTLSTPADGGYSVLTHRTVPPDDGGLALGQLVAGAARAPAGASERGS